MLSAIGHSVFKDMSGSAFGASCSLPIMLVLHGLSLKRTTLAGGMWCIVQGLS